MSVISGVDLSALPKITFAETNSANVEAAIFRHYESRAGLTLYPGDPVRLFLESLAYEVTVENNVIDLAAKQNLLAFAAGANLDHLGALMGVSRIAAQPARATIRFSLPSPLGFDVPVPEGSRVTTRDGKVFFATQTAAKIPAGALYADVAALCQSAGASGSGLLPGQVDCLVDPLPYIAAVSNIDTTQDGADIEDDERLRERIRMAPESFTVAGSHGAYIARVLAVSADISEVSVTTPEPGVVDVRFVLDNGLLPDAAMCALVEEALTAEDVRPLTDNVLVGAPDPVNYSIRGRWFLKRSDENMLSTITTRVNAAVEIFRQWQRAKPGRDIVPSYLIELVMTAGAKRVVVESPDFTEIRETQIAQEAEIDFTFGGLEWE